MSETAPKASQTGETVPVEVISAGVKQQPAKTFSYRHSDWGSADVYRFSYEGQIFPEGVIDVVCQNVRNASEVAKTVRAAVTMDVAKGELFKVKDTDPAELKKQIDDVTVKTTTEYVARINNFVDALPEAVRIVLNNEDNKRPDALKAPAGYERKFIIMPFARENDVYIRIGFQMGQKSIQVAEIKAIDNTPPKDGEVNEFTAEKILKLVTERVAPIMDEVDTLHTRLNPPQKLVPTLAARQPVVGG